jgi:hypothetical protein
MLFAPIVEGHGEVEAVPALLHTIAKAPPAHDLQVNLPIRVKSGSFLNDRDYFRRFVGLPADKAAPRSGVVLILQDCDDDCPARLGPRLLKDAVSVRADAAPPASAARLRNAKGWLSERMERSYDPITHQIRFTRRFDVVQARENASFDRLYRRVRALIEASD